jgi:hypothetical protein
MRRPPLGKTAQEEKPGTGTPNQRFTPRRILEQTQHTIYPAEFQVLFGSAGFKTKGITKEGRG